MKPFPSFPEVQTDRLLSRLVQAISETFLSLAKAVTNERIVFAPLTTNDTAVFHGLGQPPATWEVVGLDAAEVVYESSTVNDRRKFLLLKASGNCNARIRFS